MKIATTLSALIQNIDSTCETTQSEAIRSVSKGLTIRNWLIGYYIVEFKQNGQTVSDKFKIEHKKSQAISEKSLLVPIEKLKDIK